MKALSKINVHKNINCKQKRQESHSEFMCKEQPLEATCISFSLHLHFCLQKLFVGCAANSFNARRCALVLEAPWTQEQILVAVKPHGVQQRLVGTLMQCFERWGSKLVGMKMLQAPESTLAENYQDLHRKPSYPVLISYLSSVGAIVWEVYHVPLSQGPRQNTATQQRQPLGQPGPLQCSHEQECHPC